MDNQKTSETCDKCKEPITILVADLEPLLKDDLPVLCDDCRDKLLDEETEEMPMRCFEYYSVSMLSNDESDGFNELGQGGWELVAVSGGLAYFKKEVFKEKLS